MHTSVWEVVEVQRSRGPTGLPQGLHGQQVLDVVPEQLGEQLGRVVPARQSPATGAGALHITLSSDIYLLITINLMIINQNVIQIISVQQQKVVE